MPKRSIKIFISSPMDVKPEREAAEEALLKLGLEFEKYLNLEVYRYENEAMLVTQDYQSQIDSPGDVDLFICILWSRLGTPLSLLYKRPDGSTYSSGTEYEFENAMESYIAKGTPNILIYHKIDDVDLKKQAAASQKKALDAFLDKWSKNSDRTIKGAINEFKEEEGFSKILEKHVRRLIVKKFILPEDISSKDADWYENPYRGLDSFELEHSPVFYGRSHVINELKKLIVNNSGLGKNSLILMGQSGCGKSSLVKAGLLPSLLKDKSLEDLDFNRYCILNLNNLSQNIFTELSNSLTGKTSLQELLSYELNITDLSQLLKNNPEKAVEYIKSVIDKVVSARKNKAPKLILVMDQMEKIFTSELVTATDRKALLRLLLLMSRTGRILFIGTLRSDFYHYFSSMEDFLELKDGCQYDLLPPSFIELSQIIRFPALKAGLTFEEDESKGDALDDYILEEAVKMDNCLPLLEFTLQRLYESMDKAARLLTFNSYEEIGGLRGSLNLQAERSLSILPEDIQKSFKSVFLQFVRIQDNTDSYSSRNLFTKNIQLSEQDKLLLDAFISSRLLVSSRNRDGETFVRVAHESIFEHWPRLKQLILDNKEFILIRENIERALNTWFKENKHADFLIPAGKSLDSASKLLEAYRNQLDINTQLYITESMKRAKKLKRIRRSIACAAAVFIIASAAGGYVLFQRNKAEKTNTQYNESLFLASQSRQQLKAGNRLYALELAERALPKDLKNPEKPLVHEAEAAYVAAYFTGEFSPRSVLRHSDAVSQAIFSKDGKIAVTNAGNYLAVWNTETGSLIKCFSPEKDYVTSFDISPDGRLIIEGCYDGTSKLYNIAGEKLYDLDNVQSAIRFAQFSTDGKKAFTASELGTITLWDSATGKKLLTLDKHTKAFKTVGFINNGSNIYSSSNDGTSIVWDAETGEITAEYDKDTVFINPDQFSASNKIMMVNNEGTIKIISVSTGNTIATYKGPKNDTVSYATSFSRKRLAVISGTTANIYDLIKGELLGSIDIKDSSIESLTFSPDDSLIIVTSASGASTLWEAGDYFPSFEFQLHTDKIKSVNFSDDGKRIITTSEDKTAIIWDVKSDNLIADLRGDSKYVPISEFSPDGKKIAAVLDDYSIALYNSEDGKTQWKIPGHKDYVNNLVFSTDGKLIATASKDGKALIIDISDGRKIAELGMNGTGVNHISFSHDNKQILVSLSDNKLLIYDASDFKLLSTFSRNEGGIFSAAYRKDDKYIIVPQRKSIEVLDAKTLKSVKNIQADAENLYFSPDGKYMISTYGYITTLFSTDEFNIIAKLEGHGEEIMSVNFSPDSKYCAIAARDGTSAVWQCETGKMLSYLDKDGNQANFAAFTPDGKYIFTEKLELNNEVITIYDAADYKALTTLTLIHGGSDVKFSPDGTRMLLTSELYSCKFAP